MEDGRKTRMTIEEYYEKYPDAGKYDYGYYCSKILQDFMQVKKLETKEEYVKRQLGDFAYKFPNKTLEESEERRYDSILAEGIPKFPEEQEHEIFEMLGWVKKEKAMREKKFGTQKCYTCENRIPLNPDITLCDDCVEKFYGPNSGNPVVFDLKRYRADKKEIEEMTRK